MSLAIHNPSYDDTRDPRKIHATEVSAVLAGASALKTILTFAEIREATDPATRAVLHDGLLHQILIDLGHEVIDLGPDPVAMRLEAAVLDVIGDETPTLRLLAVPESPATPEPAPTGLLAKISGFFRV